MQQQIRTQICVILYFTALIIIGIDSYHSNAIGGETVNCGSECIVNDINKSCKIKIRHIPSYHTYSSWLIEGKNYIIAYRDKSDQQCDIEADIYTIINSKRKLIGTVAIIGYINNVYAYKATSNKTHDIVFEYSAGMLNYMSIVRLVNNTAKTVFEYGASEISIIEGVVPTIIAKSNAYKVEERFIWDQSRNRFVLPPTSSDPSANKRGIPDEDW